MNSMVFRRSRNMLRPINSTKNIVQDVAIIAAAAQRSQNIIQSVDSATLADTDAVTRGSRVNTVYIECWLYGNAVAGVNSPVTWGIYRNPGGNIPPGSPSGAGTFDNKRNYIAMGKGLIGASGNGQPGYLIRGWFSIPRRYRMQQNADRLSLEVENNTANDINFCFLSIYKWYR